MQSDQSNECASFDWLSGILALYKDHSKCRSSLPADVTRYVAQLSAPDEMSAPIPPTHLHNNSYKVVLDRIATPSGVVAGEFTREGERGFCGHVTCIMIVTGVRFLYATQKLRQDALSHCSQPGASRRVVEHPDYSRRLARFHPL